MWRPVRVGKVLAGRSPSTAQFCAASNVAISVLLLRLLLLLKASGDSSGLSLVFILFCFKLGSSRWGNPLKMGRTYFWQNFLIFQPWLPPPVAASSTFPHSVSPLLFLYFIFFLLVTLRNSFRLWSLSCLFIFILYFKINCDGISRLPRVSIMTKKHSLGTIFYSYLLPSLLTLLTFLPKKRKLVHNPN